MDLSIPVSGIPIQVGRVYDSLEANQQGDFGFGWSLGAQDPRIQESVPSTDQSGFGIFTATPFQVGSTVTLTNPEGRRVTFTFDPVISGASLFGPVWSPRFTPEPGVYDTLEVDDTTLTVRADGTVGLFLFGFAYNPSNYRLTTKEGIVYQYDQFDGLIDITDRNGNVLTYSDNGITSSTGQSIDFIRDSQGRITEIIDPAGNFIDYRYDDNGDLVAVTDRTDNTTQFVYEGGRPHLLDEVIDPLGRSGIRSEYDDNGQLTRLLDAEGNDILLDFDAVTSTQTLIDALGNLTTFIFDDRGNVVQEIDALGGVIERTYDANNNLLSETDPLGKALVL